MRVLTVVMTVGHKDKLWIVMQDCWPPGRRWCLLGLQGAVVGNDEFLWVVQCTFCGVSEGCSEKQKLHVREMEDRLTLRCLFSVPGSAVIIRIRQRDVKIKMGRPLTVHF